MTDETLAPHGAPPCAACGSTKRTDSGFCGGCFNLAPSGAIQDCASCVEMDPLNECPESKRPCGHHCNHIWENDFCDWCRLGLALNDESNFDAVHKALTEDRLIDPDADSDALVEFILARDAAVAARAWDAAVRSVANVNPNAIHNPYRQEQS